MDRTEQLAWERRFGRIAAASAFAAIAVTVASIAYRVSAIPRSPESEREGLRVLSENGSEFLMHSAIQGAGLLLVAPVLYYLARVVRFRRPELPRVALVLAIAAPLAFATADPILRADRIDAADRFVATDPPTTRDLSELTLRTRARVIERTEEQAEDAVGTPPAAVVGLGIGGQLALAIAFVLIGINAMRAGVLSRFFGIITVIIGALYVLPLGGGPAIIQVFWLAALGLLFLDRWPGGRGPAWDSGEALPWPTAQQRAQARAPEQQWSGDEEPAYEDAEGEDSAEKRAQRAANKRRRKRKQRR